MQIHKKNGVLDALLPEDLEQLRDSLSVIKFERGAALYNPGDLIRQIYFPHDAVLSLLTVMKDGRKAETATLGCEGLAGVEIVLDSNDLATHLCLVQVSGVCSCSPAEPIRRLVRQSPHALSLFAAFNRALFVEIMQSVACNALHNVEQRAARWMLMTQDRARSDSFMLTQEFLAEMLGVRRATVNIVSNSLQQQGVISYHRGLITITNRQELERISCECYSVVREIFEQVLTPHINHAFPHPVTVFPKRTQQLS